MEVSEFEIRELLAAEAAKGEWSELVDLCRTALGEEDVSLREQQDAWDRIDQLLQERR